MQLDHPWQRQVITVRRISIWAVKSVFIIIAFLSVVSCSKTAKIDQETKPFTDALLEIRPIVIQQAFAGNHDLGNMWLKWEDRIARCRIIVTAKILHPDDITIFLKDDHKVKEIVESEYRASLKLREVIKSEWKKHSNSQDGNDLPINKIKVSEIQDVIRDWKPMSEEDWEVLSRLRTWDKGVSHQTQEKLREAMIKYELIEKS